MMPGVNCSVLGCGSCRRSKGIGIFKLPVAKDEAHRKWRNDWLGEVTKAREIDQDFREQIKNDKVHACEKHFKPEDIEICKFRFIFCQTVEICSPTFTTRNHNSTGRVAEFVRLFVSVAASCSIYISCLFSNHSISVDFLVHSPKMTHYTLPTHSSKNLPVLTLILLRLSVESKNNVIRKDENMKVKQPPF